jgi:hypothetical protein
VNCTPLLVTASSVTVTGPLVAPGGTTSVTLASLQDLVLATTPLIWTVLLPWLEPKPEPLIVTIPPTEAAGGVKLLIVGSITSNVMLDGLEIEFTVAVTSPGPDGAVPGTVATICELLQLVIEVASTPLKLTVLLPCVAPKFEPVMVTLVLIGPRTGETPVTNGEVPTLKETWSNVAVARAEVVPLATPSPAYTFCAMLMVWVLPICVHAIPSGDAYALSEFPVRTIFIQ